MSLSDNTKPNKDEGQTTGCLLLADYLTESELANALDMTVRGLRLWRTKRQGPAWTKLGNKIVYRRGALRDWLKAQEHQPVRSRVRSHASSTA